MYFLGNLRYLIGNVSQSTVDYGAVAENGVDGKIGGPFYECVHTNHGPSQWWKAKFNRTVAINYVHFYNRLDAVQARSSDLLIKALLTNNGLTTGTLCANTGDMDGVDDKIFYCKTPGTLADELMIINKRGDDEPLNFCEVQVFGFLSSEV